MGQDWIDIVEATYDLDSDEETWLNGILEAARPTLDQGLGAAALLYDASGPQGFVANRFSLRWAPEGISRGRCMQLFAEPERGPVPAVETFGRYACGLVSDTYGQTFPAVLDRCKQMGIKDMMAINGLDASLHGCFIAGHLPSQPRLTRYSKKMWTRVSSHLAAAYRLRRSRSSGAKATDGEAVLSPSGRLEHATGPAKDSDARTALRESVVRLEKARGKMRREDPEDAVSSWQGLVDARWTLVDQFDRDGRRFIVAHSNDAPTYSLATLSPRELQVVALVALGHADKQVAYELGLSPSTVRVLVMRATRKLKLNSRAELTRVYWKASKTTDAQDVRDGQEDRPPQR